MWFRYGNDNGKERIELHEKLSLRKNNYEQISIIYSIINYKVYNFDTFHKIYPYFDLKVNHSSKILSFM